MGIIAAGILIVIFAYDIFKGAKTQGIKKEIKEIVIAIALAVGVWVGLCIILGTSAPINAIVSCSMLPELERGDMIFLQGNDVIHTTEISMTESEVEDITSKALIKLESREFTVDGSMYSYCSANTNDNLCYLFREQPELFEEYHGPLKFTYNTCKRVNIDDEQQFSTICLDNVQYDNKIYDIDMDSDIVVYSPKDEDLFSLVGDIIHRAYLRIKTPENNYYLIKGDNNPVTDLQMADYSRERGNSIVNEDQVKGKVIFRVPYLGYVKLLLSGMVVEPTGCDSYYVNN